MLSQLAAFVLLVLFIIADQWAFRCQRVGQEILLLVKDRASGASPFTELMPTRYVALVWLARLLWIAGAIFAWKAWGWLGPVAVILYVFALGSVVDMLSPWPSYLVLLRLLRERIESGSVAEGIFILHSINDVERRISQG